MGRRDADALERLMGGIDVRPTSRPGIVVAAHGDYDATVTVEVLAVAPYTLRPDQEDAVAPCAYVGFRVGPRAKQIQIVPVTDCPDPLSHASDLARRELAQRCLQAERR